MWNNCNQKATTTTKQIERKRSEIETKQSGPRRTQNGKETKTMHFDQVKITKSKQNLPTS